MLFLKVLGYRLNIFGNNIPKSVFCTAHYIISRSTQTEAAVVNDAECDHVVKVVTIT